MERQSSEKSTFLNRKTPLFNGEKPLGDTGEGGMEMLWHDLDTLSGLVAVTTALRRELQSYCPGIRGRWGTIAVAEAVVVGTRLLGGRPAPLVSLGLFGLFVAWLVREATPEEPSWDHGSGVTEEMDRLGANSPWWSDEPQSYTDSDQSSDRKF